MAGLAQNTFDQVGRCQYYQMVLLLAVSSKAYRWGYEEVVANSICYHVKVVGRVQAVRIHYFTVDSAPLVLPATGYRGTKLRISGNLIGP